MSVGGSRSVNVQPTTTSGLQNVIVVEDASTAVLSYDAGSSAAAASARWYRFSALGGGYAEPVNTATANGSITSIQLSRGDMGYIVETNGRQFPYWVVDYATHLPDMTGFAVNPESDCDRVMFTADGGFDRIVYYSINGAPIELNREIELSYYDLEFPSSSGDNTDSPSEDWRESWQQYTHTVTLSYISGYFSTLAPLCNTAFHVSGDRFLKQWGNTLELTSSNYTTRRVEAKTWALQAERDNDNEQNSSASGLGGSAPCDISFRAVPTDAVVFREWQFSVTEDFNDVLYRFNEDDFTYTFNEYGTMYIRYVCSDASGECNFEGDVYTVMIGESKLLCPNAFSPQNQDGVNDEWKVSYSSLVSYDCHIFNRWGKQLFSSTNPAEGWDGKVGGKIVPSGVYFYVIKAEGADGVKYNLSGDINVVGSKLKPSTESAD